MRAKQTSRRTDILTPAQRSHLMSRIRSRGNRTTELAMVALLRRAGIRGWRRHVALARKVPGRARSRPIRPDFVFPRQRVAVFVDGCFWHGCPRHSTRPRQNAGFWRGKIEANRRRDRESRRELRARGWTVIAVWEHTLKSGRTRGLVGRLAAATGCGRPRGGADGKAETEKPSGRRA